MSNLLDYQEFYFRGFKELQIDADSADRLKEVCSQLYVEPSLKTGFSWEKKYSNTVDLRPNVYDYDPIFMELLCNNYFPEVVDRLSQRQLFLSHIQVRKSFLGPSYMEWHRDSYYYDHLVGAAPGAYKIIIYPTHDRLPEDRLQILNGSNLCSFPHKETDFSLINHLSKTTIKSSDSTCLFFDTHSFHNVIPEVNEAGSLRIIYSFVTQDQFKDTFSKELVHRRTKDLYDSMRNR